MEISRRSLLAATAALAGPALAKLPWDNKAFPKGFLWGTATAGHQVEGNNVNSDIWALEHVTPSIFSESSGDAANSLALWPADLDLVRRMGLNTYRFSLEWARIEPAPGEFSIAMLDHYAAIVEGCRARGLTPMVTFNHFTTPRWFAAMGGWEGDDAVSFFERFCDRSARRLADMIGYATTLNEPNLLGQLTVLLPPSEGRKLADRERAANEAAARYYAVSRFQAGLVVETEKLARLQANLLVAHRRGRLAIKAARSDLPVGVSLAIADDQAAGPNSMRDAVRTKLYDVWLRAARSDDFIGVQNYERSVWNDKGKLPTPPGVETNDMGSEVYPASLAGAVRYAHAISQVPVIVTEHGVNATEDRIRARLIPAALAELQRVMTDGVPVKGYVHWSLVDNYEWMFGYKFKFGLHTLDRRTFARTPKPSASVLGGIARRNAL